jgi:hypothetical protein
MAAYRGELKPGLGSYDFFRVEEINLMVELLENEEIYSRRPIPERARMIARSLLPKMIDRLNENRAYEAMKKKSARQDGGEN